MNLYNYLQINTNFFYTKKFNDIGVSKFSKFEIPVEKLSQDKLDALLENIVFNNNDSNSYLFVSTNQGEFLFQHVTNEKSEKKIIELLNNNSTDSICYYFNGVDYFTYARFGISENGKISRFLSFNSEAEDEKDIVTWIGKPHKWEYETHTFYSKQKLIDFEMDFDNDTLCEIIEYYLPFAGDNLTINSAVVYSMSQDVLDDSKNIFSKNPLVVSNATRNKVSKHLAEIKSIPATIKGYKYKDKIMLSNNIISANTLSADSLDTLIGHTPKAKTYKLADFNEQSFKKIFCEFFTDLANAKVMTMREAINTIEEVDDSKNYHEFNILFSITENKKVHFLILDTGRHYLSKRNIKFSFFRRQIQVGTALDEKTINNLYKKISKLKVF